MQNDNLPKLLSVRITPNYNQVGGPGTIGGVNISSSNGTTYEQVNSSTIVERGVNNFNYDRRYHFIYPNDQGMSGQLGSDGLYWRTCLSCHSPLGAYNYAANNSRERIYGQVIGEVIVTFGTEGLSNAGAIANASRAGRYVNLASPSRTAHIIAGDATGGGHAWFGSLKSFSNGLSGAKSMFPASWSKSKIMNAVSHVAVNNPWVQQTGKAGALLTKAGQPVRYVIEGVYQGTTIRVVTTGTEIITAFPIN